MAGTDTNSLIILTTELVFYARVLRRGQGLMWLRKQMCPRPADKFDPSLMIVINKAGCR